MLLAVKAKRVTFTSSASSGSAAASGSGVSITLHCCRSLRATTKSVDGIVSIPASSHAAIFAPSDDRFATAITFKTVFGFGCRNASPSLPAQTRSVCARERATKQSIFLAAAMMDCFAPLAMTRDGAEGDCSRDRAQSALGIQIAQLALENLAGGFARHRVHELDVLWHLEVGEASAQKFLHGGR